MGVKAIDGMITSEEEFVVAQMPLMSITLDHVVRHTDDALHDCSTLQRSRTRGHELASVWRSVSIGPTAHPHQLSCE